MARKRLDRNPVSLCCIFSLVGLMWAVHRRFGQEGSASPSGVFLMNVRPSSTSELPFDDSAIDLENDFFNLPLDFTVFHDSLTGTARCG